MVSGIREVVFPVIESKSEETGGRFIAEQQARAIRDKVNELDEAGILADLAYVMARIDLGEYVPEVLRQPALDFDYAIRDLKWSGSQAYQIARGASVEEVMAQAGQQEVIDFPREKAREEGLEKLAKAFHDDYRPPSIGAA
jgi:hypothetical protein